MNRIALTSQIPADNPRKKPIEDAILESLRPRPGQWAVRIALSRTSRTRWFIRLQELVSGLTRTIFVNGVKRQHPRLIRNRILESLD